MLLYPGPTIHEGIYCLPWCPLHLPLAGHPITSPSSLPGLSPDVLHCPSTLARTTVLTLYQPYGGGESLEHPHPPPHLPNSAAGVISQMLAGQAMGRWTESVV